MLPSSSHTRDRVHPLFSSVNVALEEHNIGSLLVTSADSSQWADGIG